jgi:hypothetical protein
MIMLSAGSCCTYRVPRLLRSAARGVFLFACILRGEVTQMMLPTADDNDNRISPAPAQTPQRYDGPLPSGMPQPVPGRPTERRPAPPLEQA